MYVCGACECCICIQNQSRTLDAFLCHSPDYGLDMVSHWTKRQLYQLSWLAWVLLRSAYLHPSRDTGIHSYVQCFTRMLRIQAQVLMCVEQASLPTVVFPLHLEATVGSCRHYFHYQSSQTQQDLNLSFYRQSPTSCIHFLVFPSMPSKFALFHGLFHGQIASPEETCPILVSHCYQATGLQLEDHNSILTYLL